MTLPRVELREDGWRLRPWRTTDAEAVFQACQDPAIQRWTSIPRPYGWEDARRFVGEYTETSWSTGTAAPFAIVDDDDRVLGAMTLIHLSLARGEAELAYWVAPSARGRGVATSAARAIARWALAPAARGGLGLHRLAWRAEVGNHASRLVAARVGFRVEGIARGATVRPGRAARTDAWTGGLLAGELRERGPDSPGLALAARRAHLFLTPMPRLGVDGDLALRRPRPADIAVLDEGSPGRGRRVVNASTAGWRRGDHAIFTIAAPSPASPASSAPPPPASPSSPPDGCVGMIEVWLVGDPLTTDVAEVGYLVAPAHQRRGVATAALRAACDFAFGSLGVRRLEWRAVVGNEASRRVAIKAGFTIEGTQRANLREGAGDPRDAWTGARLAPPPGGHAGQ